MRMCFYLHTHMNYIYAKFYTIYIEAFIPKRNSGNSVPNIPLLSQLAFLCLRRTTLGFLLLPLLTASIAAGATFPDCDRPFTCGALQNITYLFTGGARPHYCGPPQFQLTCLNDTHTELTSNSVTYRVLSINQALKALTLAQSDFYNTTCPTKFTNSTLDSTVFAYGDSNQDLNLVYGCSQSQNNNTPYNRFSCELSGVNYTDAFYLVGPVPVDPILQGSTQCNVTVETKVNGEAAQQLTGNQTTLREALISGFSVNYSDPYGNQCSNCSWSGGSCGFDSDSNLPICICGDVRCPIPTITLSNDTGSSDTGRNNSALILGAAVVSIGGIITILLLYIIVKKLRQSEFIFFWKTKTENYRNIEAFLKNCGSLSIKRYTYSDIKKITGSFRTNLGQGGFGCVYKGKLENGRLVAVKVLKGLKGNGDEFINEIATISRTSHVHIVTLLGFCFDSCHRALIYEFMPNGSLDKFIHNGSSLTNQQLGWEALYQIAVGIAQGLEYLHRGCNTRILHFDIKPHNILLNEDFCPKISDFGLAKLCPQKESIISLVGTRGTTGYIAPEVFSRNFGEVSHKSDVYSYGMMVLEMVDARKNINVEVDHTSEIYFPHWIYKRLELDEELGLHGIMGDEAKTSARKMIIVGLWCIQTDPSHRPPMKRVLEMLEGSLESLQIPPKPFLFSPSRAPVYSSTTQSTLMS